MGDKAQIEWSVNPNTFELIPRGTSDDRETIQVSVDLLRQLITIVDAAFELRDCVSDDEKLTREDALGAALDALVESGLYDG